MRTGNARETETAVCVCLTHPAALDGIIALLALFRDIAL